MKRITLNILLKLSYLRSDFTLTLADLNLALIEPSPGCYSRILFLKLRSSHGQTVSNWYQLQYAKKKLQFLTSCFKKYGGVTREVTYHGVTGKLVRTTLDATVPLSLRTALKFELSLSKKKDSLSYTLSKFIEVLLWLRGYWLQYTCLITYIAFTSMLILPEKRFAAR